MKKYLLAALMLLPLIATAEDSIDCTFVEAGMQCTLVLDDTFNAISVLEGEQAVQNDRIDELEAGGSEAPLVIPASCQTGTNPLIRLSSRGIGIAADQATSQGVKWVTWDNLDSFSIPNSHAVTVNGMVVASLLDDSSACVQDLMTELGAVPTTGLAACQSSSATEVNSLFYKLQTNGSWYPFSRVVQFVVEGTNVEATITNSVIRHNVFSNFATAADAGACLDALMQ